MNVLLQCTTTVIDLRLVQTHMEAIPAHVTLETVDLAPSASVSIYQWPRPNLYCVINLNVKTEAKLRCLREDLFVIKTRSRPLKDLLF